MTYRSKYHDKVLSDLDDVITLLRLVLDLDLSHDFKVAEEGIKCYQVSRTILVVILY